jgi:hypothetical protein
VSELNVQFAKPGIPKHLSSIQRPGVVWTLADKCIDAGTGKLTVDCLNLIKLGKSAKVQVVLVGSPSILGSIRGVETLPVSLIPAPKEKMSIEATSDWLKQRLGRSMHLRAAAPRRVRKPGPKQVNPQYLTQVLTPKQRREFFLEIQSAQDEEVGSASKELPAARIKFQAPLEEAVPQRAVFYAKTAKAGA